LIYNTYEAIRRTARPWGKLLDIYTGLARHQQNPWRDTLAMRTLATACELPARAMKDYGKPQYEVRQDLGDMEITLPPRVIHSLPFADLLNFPVEGDGKRPKVLIAAALSGHYATLLQDTIRGFARDFDPYITDWKDAREVPAEEGPFGFDDYVRHLIEFLEVMGPGTHLVATCQAAPPAMVAAAVLAKRNPECVPASLTLMGGPVDTRVNPIFINKIADKIPLRAFQRNNIHTIPKGYPGSGRRVYPGFFQLSGFIMLNPRPHVRQYYNFVRNSLAGDDEALQKFRDFYDEYFAVLDMTEAFYLDTLQKVFIEHHIPTGQMTYEGKLVDFASVDNLSLLTVEGENDNFCPPGQTEAAQEVFSGIPADRRKNHIQEGVGHYGVFSGSRFQKDIYPVIRDFIHAADTEALRVPVAG
jgi:poly(3-hydroxybutyrate) depolymerase